MSNFKNNDGKGFVFYLIDDSISGEAKFKKAFKFSSKWLACFRVQR